MANNTEHWKWIVYATQGLEWLFRNRTDICVLSDVLWYPVEGEPKICSAPDVQVTVGRPPGARSSYKQWEEGGLPPQFVMEFLSASNTAGEMARKAIFFQQHGVEEYLIYDMEHGDLEVMVRNDGILQPLPPDLRSWRSALLAVTFSTDQNGVLSMAGPDGERLPSYDDWMQRAEAEKARAEAEKARADAEKIRADRLAARLKELGVSLD